MTTHTSEQSCKPGLDRRIRSAARYAAVHTLRPFCSMLTELLGRPLVPATRRYPQAIAVALGLRHRWPREELVKFAKRFGVKLTTKDLSDTANTDASDASAPDADAAGTSRHQLQQKQIAFTERNIATDDAALNDLQKLGWMTTPVS